MKGKRLIRKPKTTETKSYPIAPTCLLCILMAVGLILLIFCPKKDYSPQEKRYLADAPAFSFQRLLDGSYGADFETYLSDHFPGRTLFVGAYSYYTLLCGNNGANGVYFGADDYLINAPVSQADSKLEGNLTALTALSQNTGLETTLVPVPTAGYVCAEQLPAIHDAYLDDQRFDTIVSATGGAMDVLDLREQFKEETQQLYYRTDHHWTTYAAYLAYENLCAQWGLTPLAQSEFTVEEIAGFRGTTVSTSGFYLTPPDTLEVWHNDLTDAATLTIWEGNDKTDYASMYFPINAQGDDPYTVFLDGNHPLYYVENPAAAGGTLMVVQDSYAHCLIPFLSAHYQKIVVVDPRYYKLSITQLAQQEGAGRLLILYGLDNLCTDTDIPWIM